MIHYQTNVSKTDGENLLIVQTKNILLLYELFDLALHFLLSHFCPNIYDSNCYINII